MYDTISTDPIDDPIAPPGSDAGRHRAPIKRTLMAGVALLVCVAMVGQLVVQRNEIERQRGALAAIQRGQESLGERATQLERTL